MFFSIITQSWQIWYSVLLCSEMEKSLPLMGIKPGTVRLWDLLCLHSRASTNSHLNKFELPSKSEN